jgi:hypothetical protein
MQAPNDCDLHHKGSGICKSDDLFLDQVWEIESSKLERASEDRPTSLPSRGGSQLRKFEWVICLRNLTGSKGKLRF